MAITRKQWAPMANMPRPKAGTSKEAAADRRAAFVREYIKNGRNGTQAAIAAGFSEKGARVTAAKLLAEPNIAAMVDARVARASEISGLTVERTLMEVARLAYSDPRPFLHSDGTLKPVEEWTHDMAASVASLEVLEEYEGTGDDRKLVGHTKKLKFWDKNAAIEKAMKHLGLYEKDNSQTRPNLALQVVLVDSAAAEPMVRKGGPLIEVATQ